MGDSGPRLEIADIYLEYFESIERIIDKKWFSV
jgi:hypothetical protein